MSSEHARLHIVRTRGDGGYSTPNAAIDKIVALCGLHSLDDWTVESASGDDRIESILSHAAATSDPVLVVPDELSLPETHATASEVSRLLVPTDLSADERHVVRPWIERALQLGLDVEQIHVLTDETRPAIWEGSGHHADAWRAELTLRHQTPGAILSVCSGDPAMEIADKSMGASLVLVSWRGSTTAGHPRLLRRLLSKLRQPVLIVRRPPRHGHREIAGRPV